MAQFGIITNLLPALVLLVIFNLNLNSNLVRAWLAETRIDPSTKCAQLYSEPDFKGLEFVSADGQEFLDLSENFVEGSTEETWNNKTASFHVKEGCALFVCSSPYLDGDCTAFTADQINLKPVIK